MKVIFDPIYSGRIHKCSSAYKYKVIAARLLEDPRTFIHWLIPDWVDAEGMAWLPKDDRIQYHEVPIMKDRVREYQRFPQWLEDRVFCIGLLWDFDVIITMRTQQIQNIQVNQSPYRNNRLSALRRVILLEEMALLSSRMTVFTSHPFAVDHGTVSGHLLADRSYVTVQHVRDQIIRTAREILAPSKVKKIDQSLVLARTSSFTNYETLSSEHIAGEKKPLRVTFIGRMNKTMSKFSVANEATEYDWILQGDLGLAYKVSTVSETAKEVPSHCEIMFNNRDAFWDMIRTRTDVGMYLEKDGEFSLAMVEPLVFGVPLLLCRTEQTLGMVGREYPFFVSTKTEILAYLKLFRENYAEAYSIFIKWRDEAYIPLMRTGVYKTDLYEDLLIYIRDFEKTQKAIYMTMFPVSKMEPEEADFLKEFSRVLSEGSEIVIPSDFRKWKGFGTLKIKAKEGGWREHHMAFQVQWTPMRLWAKNHFGYVDGSTKTGHLIHPERFQK